MDPISLIMGALAAGVASGLADTATGAVKDAYAGWSGVEGVHAPLPVNPRVHEPGLAQHAQVSTHRWTTDREPVRQLADGHLAVRKQLQDATSVGDLRAAPLRRDPRSVHVEQRATMGAVTGALSWDDEDAAHIRSRSARHPGADNIEPDWTLEAAADPHRVVRNPDPKAGWDTSASSATRRAPDSCSP